MDNQDYVLSLDIGTTTIKSFVYDQLGQIQGHSSKKVKKLLLLQFHTVRNLHFISKNSTLNSRENCRFYWG